MAPTPLRQFLDKRGPRAGKPPAPGARTNWSTLFPESTKGPAMSETRQVCCDRCGAIVLEDLTRLAVETGRLRDVTKLVDLCPDCAQQFKNFLRTAPAAV